MATLLQPRRVIYCGECGMPPEYCEYGPDFETHCNPWLLKNHPDMHFKLKILRKSEDKGAEDGDDGQPSEGAIQKQRPSEPWSTEERLTEFYMKYQPDKVDDVPTILGKYAGKEDRLFTALVKKYGPEPDDPFYASEEEDDDSDDENLNENVGELSISDKKKKRRGAAAKKTNEIDTRVIIQKILRNKRKSVTIIVGMDTVPDIKLKEVSKACSKRFAGSSSVKDTPQGKKEIIIQGDHMDDVAVMLVDKFKVPADAVFLDIDGEFVPFK